jgi:hypothetical protein
MKKLSTIFAYATASRAFLFLAVIALLFFALKANAQVTLRWEAETTRINAYNVSAFHGETIRLEPSFAANGTPVALAGADATLYWQTNGMGAAWWDKTCAQFTDDQGRDRIRAEFTADDDPGAAMYAWFIGIRSADGLQYRAYGSMAMRGSPGFVPNTLPLPIPVLDFAVTAYLNAPWLLASELPPFPDLSDFATHEWVLENVPAPDLSPLEAAIASAQSDADCALHNANTANAVATDAISAATNALAKANAAGTVKTVGGRQPDVNGAVTLTAGDVGAAPAPFNPIPDEYTPVSGMTFTQIDIDKVGIGNITATGLKSIRIPEKNAAGLFITAMGFSTPALNFTITAEDDSLESLVGEHITTTIIQTSGLNASLMSKFKDGAWFIFPKWTSLNLNNPTIDNGEKRVNLFLPGLTANSSLSAGSTSMGITGNVDIYLGNTRPFSVYLGKDGNLRGRVFYPRGAWKDTSGWMTEYVIVPQPYDPEPWMFPFLGIPTLEERVAALEKTPGITAPSTNTVKWVNGTLSVTVTSGGTLTASTNGWAEGMAAAVCAIVDTPATFTLSPSFTWTASGYSAIPASSVTQCAFWRIGTNIYFNALHTQPK